MWQARRAAICCKTARFSMARALRFAASMTFTPSAAPASPAPTPISSLTAGYHGAVSEFKRRLIESTLHQARGNRTHAARALGLQRTYLLRLIRDLGVAAPPPPPRRRRSAA